MLADGVITPLEKRCPLHFFDSGHLFLVRWPPSCPPCQIITFRPIRIKSLVLALVPRSSGWCRQWHVSSDVLAEVEHGPAVSVLLDGRVDPASHRPRDSVGTPGFGAARAPNPQGRLPFVAA
jgi:hypothetical protein